MSQRLAWDLFAWARSEELDGTRWESDLRQAFVRVHCQSWQPAGKQKQTLATEFRWMQVKAWVSACLYGSKCIPGGTAAGFGDSIWQCWNWSVPQWRRVGKGLGKTNTDNFSWSCQVYDKVTCLLVAVVNNGHPGQRVSIMIGSMILCRLPVQESSYPFLLCGNLTGIGMHCKQSAAETSEGRISDRILLPYCIAIGLAEEWHLRLVSHVLCTDWNCSSQCCRRSLKNLTWPGIHHHKFRWNAMLLEQCK